MRNIKAGIMMAALLVAMLFTGCATVAPGNDPVLVNAERNLNVAEIGEHTSELQSR